MSQPQLHSRPVAAHSAASRLKAVVFTEAGSMPANDDEPARIAGVLLLDELGIDGAQLDIHSPSSDACTRLAPCHAVPTTTRALGGAMATGVPRMETTKQSRAEAFVPVVLVPQVHRGTRRVCGRITIRLHEEAAWIRSASLADGSLF
jgi:hypothetical protein